MPTNAKNVSMAAIFNRMAQDMAKTQEATPDQWRKLRDRMQSYAYTHLPGYLAVGFYEARAIVRALGFARRRGRHAYANLSPDMVEAALWRMAWLCFTNLVYASNEKDREMAAKSLGIYLTDAYHLAIVK